MVLFKLACCGLAEFLDNQVSEWMNRTGSSAPKYDKIYANIEFCRKVDLAIEESLNLGLNK